MGLIIILSIACTLTIAFGVEYVTHLLQEKKKYTDTPEGEHKLRHHTIKLVLAVVWTAVWSAVAAAVIYEFLTNSKAYF